MATSTSVFKSCREVLDKCLASDRLLHKSKRQRALELYMIPPFAQRHFSNEDKTTAICNQSNSGKREPVKEEVFQYRPFTQGTFTGPITDGIFLV